MLGRAVVPRHARPLHGADNLQAQERPFPPLQGMRRSRRVLSKKCADLRSLSTFTLGGRWLRGVRCVQNAWKRLLEAAFDGAFATPVAGAKAHLTG